MAPLTALRRMILALLGCGVVGLGVELLLQHFESPAQIIPLGLLAAALALVAWHARDRGPRSLRLLQAHRDRSPHARGELQMRFRMSWSMLLMMLALGAAMPHMTPAIAAALVAAWPFARITDLNALLLKQGLTQDQAMALYRTAFVHINLNTASREEILLLPGAGPRMVREFTEYRPWKSGAQFDKEIAKYVGQKETDRLKRYVTFE